MRIRSFVVAFVCAVCAALPAAEVWAQTCVGLLGQRASVTVGLEGTDGASGRSVDLTVRSGPVRLGLSHSSLDKFAQVDDLLSTGIHLSWQLAEGSWQVCGVGGAEWTRYEAGPGSWSSSSAYQVVGDYGRIRTPLGISVGREFWEGHRVGINPFLTVGVVHDHEWMRWTEGGVSKRGSIGPGTSFGFTTRFARLLLRSQLSNAWTEDRALSNINNHWSLLLHLGLAF